MIVFFSSANILLFFVLSNGVTCTFVSTTNDTISQINKYDDDHKIQGYTFRYTPTGSTTESGIQGNVLLTLDKKHLCTETIACETELKSNQALSSCILQ